MLKPNEIHDQIFQTALSWLIVRDLSSSNPVNVCNAIKASMEFLNALVSDDAQQILFNEIYLPWEE